ncbi:hypothetical protein FM037_27385 [Shewanella psychropiezotolerans]|uniref:Uncharacterized protein n=1 Tax=Shewanella psychropiezotolerans TaxID=2593655 RepID=A0ABX5X4N0_9GAMM|nr:hypothetical protein [Shewanella psychropiezotolerans]QDO86306.1 hypothetical protein FM037_27385 [Shewanella psychropiezotolerans]
MAQIKTLLLALLITAALVSFATTRIQSVTHQLGNTQEMKTKQQDPSLEKKKLRLRIERMLVSEEMIKKWREGHL